MKYFIPLVFIPALCIKISKQRLELRAIILDWDCPSKSIKNQHCYMPLDQTYQISKWNDNVTSFDEKDQKPSITLICLNWLYKL